MGNSPASAARLAGTNVTTVQAGLLSAPPVAPLPVLPYTFSIPSMRVANTRSLFEDTDYASLSVVVGTNPPQTTTLKIGNVDEGTHAVGLSLTGISVPPGQNVVLTYAVVNNGHAADGDIQKALQTALNTLGSKAAAAAAAAIGGVLELGGSLAVPIIGSALGALAAWLISELEPIIFADCDGAVAAGVHIFTPAQLAAATAGGVTLSGTDYSPGTGSPEGCGSNSEYYVTWSVGATMPSGGNPIGGGGPLQGPGDGPPHHID